MARPSKVHKTPSGFRFRWSEEADTVAQVIAAYRALTRCPADKAKAMEAKVEEHRGRWRLSWAIERADKEMADAELLRYQRARKGDDKSLAPQFVRELLAQWEADPDNARKIQGRHRIIDEADAWGGTKKLNGDLDPETSLDDFYDWLLDGEEAWSFRSANEIVSMFRSILSWGHRKSWVAVVPKAAKLIKPEPMPKALVRKEIVGYLKALRAPFVQESTHTGIRPFGWRWDPKAGKNVKVPEEQKVIDRIKMMKAKGLGTRAIASTLNAEGVPTASGKGQWYHDRIAKILKRGKAKDAPGIYRIQPSRVGHLAHWLRFQLETGCRIQDWRQLKWTQVRILETPTEQGVAGYIIFEAKQHKGGKTSGKTRMLRLNRKAVGILKRYGNQNSDYVVTSPRTGRPYSRCGLQSILVTRGIRSHRLRHTFAQVAISLGVAKETVKELLGQATSAMVDMYACLTDQQVADAVTLVSDPRRRRVADQAWAQTRERRHAS